MWAMHLVCLVFERIRPIELDNPGYVTCVMECVHPVLPFKLGEHLIKKKKYKGWGMHSYSDVFI